MSESALPAQIADYLAILQDERKLSPRTVSSYKQDLQDLCRLAGATPLADLQALQLRRFSGQLHAEGLNPRSIARKLSAWRGFFRWLKQSSALHTNPATGLKAPKRARLLPKALGTDEAMQLVTTQLHDDAEHTQNRAMFELLYSSGLRVSELVNLDVQPYGGDCLGWVDFEERLVHVTGKGNKMRIVPVGNPALDALRDWLAVRATQVKTDPLPLFLSPRGKRISVRLVQLRLQRHAQTIGLSSHVHPHMLRHSFASHVLQSSGDLRAVQEMLGHSSIASTQVYTALDFQHLASVYDSAHPRAKKDR